MAEIPEFNPLARPPGPLLSRRSLFALSAAGAVGAVAAAILLLRGKKPAPAPKLYQTLPDDEGKASKYVANYYEKTADAAQNCTSCHFYLSPDRCILVAGLVSPWGMCDYWAD